MAVEEAPVKQLPESRFLSLLSPVPKISPERQKILNSLGVRFNLGGDFLKINFLTGYEGISLEFLQNANKGLDRKFKMAAHFSPNTIVECSKMLEENEQNEVLELLSLFSDGKKLSAEKEESFRNLVRRLTGFTKEEKELIARDLDSYHAVLSSSVDSKKAA